MALDSATARELTRVAQRVESATKRRDRLIVEAFEQGAGLREIGRAVGMTHPGVRRVILRNRGDLEVKHVLPHGHPDFDPSNNLRIDSRTSNRPLSTDHSDQPDDSAAEGEA